MIPIMISGVGRILVRGDHQKAITRPTQGRVRKFKILKRFKILENESIFLKYQHFLARKTPFFHLRKRSKNLTEFTKISFFRKFTLQMSIFMEHPLKPEKFSVNSIF